MPMAVLGRRGRLRRRALLGLGLALTLVAAGCHRRRLRPAPIQPPSAPSGGRPSRPAPRPRGRPRTPAAPIVQGEEGIASWYGHPFHGRPTASGEIYSMYAMTAAHRTLPFGTRVRVHDLDNGKSVDVRINDRGPFVEGRIIDLSYSAAQAMGMNGIAHVRLEILGYGESSSSGSTSGGGSRGSSGGASGGTSGGGSSGGGGTGGNATSPPPGIFAVQVGAFKDRNNAERLKDQISRQFGPVVVQGYDRGDGFFYRVRVGNENSEDGADGLARRLRDAGFATETFVVRMN
jgi:peptidoglycan lytic transglycosylase